MELILSLNELNAWVNNFSLEPVFKTHPDRMPVQGKKEYRGKGQKSPG